MCLQFGYIDSMCISMTVDWIDYYAMTHTLLDMLLIVTKFQREIYSVWGFQLYINMVIMSCDHMFPWWHDRLSVKALYGHMIPLGYDVPCILSLHYFVQRIWFGTHNNHISQAIYCNNIWTYTIVCDDMISQGNHMTSYERIWRHMRQRYLAPNLCFVVRFRQQCQ